MRSWATARERFILGTGGTRVSFAAEYEPPVLNSMAESLVVQYNERETRTVLGNLRTRLAT